MVRDGEARATLTPVQIPIGADVLHASLGVPRMPKGLVLLTDDDPHFESLAEVLREQGLATMLIDMETPKGSGPDDPTGRHGIDLLSQRLIAVIDWIRSRCGAAALPAGLLSAGDAAAASLIAAAERAQDIKAVVSIDGRPVVGAALGRVRASTLFIVGGEDETAFERSERALGHICAPAHVEVIPRATGLFDEADTREHVAGLASAWFLIAFADATNHPANGCADSLH